MPSLNTEFNSPMLAKAGHFLMKNKVAIKKIWESKARSLIPEYPHEAALNLDLNSLDLFLDDLAKKLNQSPQSADTVSSKGMSFAYGGNRATIVGYFLPQILKEYSLLREVLFQCLKDANVLTFEVQLLVNREIDKVCSNAASEFASIQAQKTEAALAAARSSNRDLEQFAGIAAHDLKSPISTVISFVEVLKEELETQPPNKEAIAKYFDIISRTAVRMSALIEALLSYSKLTKTPSKFIEVDLNSLLSEVLNSIAKNVASLNAKIIAPQKLPTVYGDPSLLGLVFQNLIANGIKFHRDEQPLIQISSSLDKSQNYWIISFKDNGVGFDPKYKEDIFILFKKINSESKEGAGIGLATCRRIIELHGGSIWSDSQPGIGSTFSFSLPRTK